MLYNPRMFRHCAIVSLIVITLLSGQLSSIVHAVGHLHEASDSSSLAGASTYLDSGVHKHSTHDHSSDFHAADYDFSNSANDDPDHCLIFHFFGANAMALYSPALTTLSGVPGHDCSHPIATPVVIEPGAFTTIRAPPVTFWI